MALLTQKQKDEAIANFQFEGILIEEGPYGSGHINDTFLLKFEIAEMGCINVILQRMNKNIFLNPEELMDNVSGVTAWLRKKILADGGDVERETLNLVNTRD